MAMCLLFNTYSSSVRILENEIGKGGAVWMPTRRVMNLPRSAKKSKHSLEPPSSNDLLNAPLTMRPIELVFPLTVIVLLRGMLPWPALLINLHLLHKKVVVETPEPNRAGRTCCGWIPEKVLSLSYGRRLGKEISKWFMLCWKLD
jgi:hypothetical protein